MHTRVNTISYLPREVDYQSGMESLKSTTVGDTVVLVSIDWLSDCIGERKLVPTGQFQLRSMQLARVAKERVPRKSKRAKENGDEEKHSRARRAPGDKFLPDQFQTAEVILNSDWCQKFFVFFCPIRGQQAVKAFRVFLHGNHLIAILALVRLARFCSRRKVSITAQNIQGIVRNIGGERRWTFRRYWYSSVFPSVRELFKDALTNSSNKIAAITFDLTIIFILPPYPGRGIFRNLT